MGAALGLAAAALYGVSDFVGGLAARRLHFLWVSLLSQVVAAVVVWMSLPWTAGTPSAGALLWGAVSGIGTATGTLALYRGLARGQMAVAGPLSAVGSAVLPAVVGFALGDRLAPVAVAGVLLAFPALWLVARQPDAENSSVREGVIDGLLAGVGFGVLFIALDQAGDTAGLWPVATGEVASIVVLLLAYVVLRPAWPQVGRPTLLLAALAGLLAVLANAAFYYATHAGLLTVAAVLTSLYPAVTVVLAALVLHERPDRSQLIGLGLCACAVTAIVVG